MNENEWDTVGEDFEIRDSKGNLIHKSVSEQAKYFQGLREQFESLQKQLADCKNEIAFDKQSRANLCEENYKLEQKLQEEKDRKAYEDENLKFLLKKYGELSEERDKLQSELSAERKENHKLNNVNRERIRVLSIASDLRSVLVQCEDCIKGKHDKDETLRAINFALNNKQDVIPPLYTEEQVRPLVEAIKNIEYARRTNNLDLNKQINLAITTLTAFKQYSLSQSEKEGV